MGKNRANEIAYFQLVVDQFVDWQNNVSNTLPPMPNDPDAQIIYKRAKLRAALDIVDVGDNYLKYFGRPTSRGIAMKSAEAAEGGKVRLLDTNSYDGMPYEKGGTLKAHFGGGDDYTITPENWENYTGAMACASSVLTVLNGFEKGRPATPKEYDVSTVKETKRLAALHTGGNVAKYKAGGFSHDYSDASTVAINALSGDAMDESPVLPVGFVAPSLTAGTVIPAPAPVVAKKDTITFHREESASMRAVAAATGGYNRDKGKAFLKGKLYVSQTGDTVDLGTPEFHQHVKDLIKQHGKSFDRDSTDQERVVALKTLQLNYDKTHDPKYLVALGVLGDANKIHTLQHRPVASLEIKRWENWKEFRVGAEAMCEQLRTLSVKAVDHSPSPVAAVKVNAGASHVVVAGESLSKIALQCDALMATGRAALGAGVPDKGAGGVAEWVAHQIASHNRLGDAGDISVGQTIALPTVAQLRAKTPVPKMPSRLPAPAVVTVLEEAPSLPVVHTARVRGQISTPEEPVIKTPANATLHIDEARTDALALVQQKLKDQADTQIHAMAALVGKSLGTSDTQTIERATAMLLAATNGLDKGKEAMTAGTIIIPNQTQIIAGVAALKETAASADSRGGSLFSSGGGEKITLGELKASIPEPVKQAMLTK